MTPKLHVCLLAAAVACASATSLAAQKAPKEQKYTVAFTFEDTTYTGTMTLKVADTAVSGAMEITDPIAVTGDVAGTLKKDELALDYPYTMGGDQPCTGRVTIAATMTADKSSATGTAHSTGCGDHDLDGSVSLKKIAAAAK
jgi:hypothetical protein